MARPRGRRFSKQHDQIWIPVQVIAAVAGNGNDEVINLVDGIDWADQAQGQERATFMGCRGMMGIEVPAGAPSATLTLAAYVIHQADTTAVPLPATSVSTYTHDILWTKVAMLDSESTRHVYEFDINIKAMRRMTSRSDIDMVFRITGLAMRYSLIIRSLVRRA